MAFSFLKNLLDTNKRDIDRYTAMVDRINLHTEKYQKLKESDFLNQTNQFKQRLTEGAKLDDLLPEAFALAREATFRVLGFSHYDVQLMAAIAFHEGKIAEQKTGEGKTLSAVPALYLNSLGGNGAHLVTVNDYLARRDAGWNGPIFHLLGLSTGVVIHNEQLRGYIYDPEYTDPEHDDPRLMHMRPCSRKEAYQADITYGTNTEFGFDYLRDNMAQNASDQVQRGYHFAIVDEVDSILIDEARTPLIISAPDAEPTEKYLQFANLASKLQSDTDFNIDEKLRSVALTEHGIKKIEKLLGVENLYEKDFDTIHHLENALKSKMLFTLDRHYVIRENQIVIVDEFTGRLMPGRRWSDGLHQAVEAKEGVKIQQESKTLATVSLQNFFRMYTKLAGMTGTAATEGEEFRKIYNLEVVIIPTHRPVARLDHHDIIYKTTRAKYTAIANLVQTLQAKKQPVLIGTTSIQKNEIIAQLLTRKKIPHQVLNAKNHEREANIIAQAGMPGAITVATNIAGRGVDIVLGGAKPNPVPESSSAKVKQAYQKDLAAWQKAHEQVIASGGVYVIGTERHESRRIDNQLRGRSGRQGDPGASQFFVSLDDEIMRIFGGEQVARMMTAFNLPEDQPLDARLAAKAIEQAQVKVEGFHFDQRKYLVEYDDVLNKQREIIYKLRQKTIENYNFHEEIIKKSKKQIDLLINLYAPDGYVSQEIDKLSQEFAEIVPISDSDLNQLRDDLSQVQDALSLQDLLHEKISKAFESKMSKYGDEVMQEIERHTIRTAIDQLWVEHLDSIENIREGIGLRSYAQKDPLVEYKQEAYSQFENLINQIDYQVVRRILRVQVQFSNAAPGQDLRSSEIDISQLNVTSPIEKSPVQLPTKIPDQLPEIKDTKSSTKTSNSALDDFASAMGAIKDEVGATKTTSSATQGRVSKNISRNDPCWCGSGKKYKKCHWPN